MKSTIGYVTTEVSGTYPYPDRLVYEDQLLAENLLLKETLKSLEGKVSMLERKMTKERVMVLRDVPREQAKQEVRELFKTGRVLYYSDVVEELRLDLRSVVEICTELKEGGELAIA